MTLVMFAMEHGERFLKIGLFRNLGFWKFQSRKQNLKSLFGIFLAFTKFSILNLNGESDLVQLDRSGWKKKLPRVKANGLF